MDERMRIRALAVARMNEFSKNVQEREDCGDEEGAHAWILARNAVRGLIQEIDEGLTLQELLKRTRS